MKIRILPDREAVAAAAAAEILAAVAARPGLVLGVATGRTMEPVYARLARAAAEGAAFGGVELFGLDEYVGLAPGHPAAFRSYLERHVTVPLGIPSERLHVPDGISIDPAEEARRHEARIRAAGGIDLQLLGLGRNGHIAFNEPGSPFVSRTRVVRLARSTREDGRSALPAGMQPPRTGITMGVGTILEARRLLLLATGAAKRPAAEALCFGPVSPACPASALRLHPDATVLLDREAAGPE
ncbi:glucosamine-6-phosphate deaminase [Mycobacterium sp. KBS0706]|uniref:glucosamine-6-phosphate deaminase n=1 Tax=Mycobacterium sp. KBS0706 TaxID=2578109 RepID=UPI00110FA77A|nr:glucosamine-6-phosphate deaminase [Mycobacterium sp. KBS0706]TSD85266.1 glucosamine-6-phosphate deaminase [Mycobacterium sp. KBS0706]